MFGGLSWVYREEVAFERGGHPRARLRYIQTRVLTVEARQHLCVRGGVANIRFIPLCFKPHQTDVNAAVDLMITHVGR